jgi:hypothetical protein
MDCILHSRIMGDKIITLDLGQINVILLKMPLKFAIPRDSDFVTAHMGHEQGRSEKMSSPRLACMNAP